MGTQSGSLEWTGVQPPDGGVRQYSAMTGAGDRLLLWGGVSFDDPEETLLDSGSSSTQRPELTIRLASR
jgi:hypothetical protein